MKDRTQKIIIFGAEPFQEFQIVVIVDCFPGWLISLSVDDISSFTFGLFAITKVSGIFVVTCYMWNCGLLLLF